ncbi:MAG TPA: hypothetical protein VK841_26360 [Polyangiaceae bacterium]|nr:hypothetical protein [Polyangiaceae bacterium]
MACRYLHRGLMACASIALAGATAACDFGDDNAAVDGGNLALDGSLAFDASEPEGSTGPGTTSEAGSATVDATTITDAGPLPWDGGPPAPGTCVPTGSMIVPRSLFSVTPLRDGRVLVSGGETLTADIYDPTTGTFSAAAPPTHFFFNYPNGLIPLPDGTILAIGGSDPSCVSSTTPEIYNPATNTWSPTAGPMNVPRHNSIPAALADGRVLVMGGYDQNTECGVTTHTSITSAEIYDPVSGTFALTASMATPRAASWAVRLLDGRIFVAGGEEYGSDSYNQTAEIFSLAADAGADAGAFTSAGTVPGTTSTGGEAMQAYVLPDGRVLVSNVGTWSFYDPAGGSFTQVSSDPIQSGGWGIALKSGDIFFAGGNDAGVPTAKTEIYSPSRGGWIALGSTMALRQLPALAELSNGYILVAGGNDINGNGQATAELCNPLPPGDAGVVLVDASVGALDGSPEASDDGSPEASDDASPE